MDSSERLRWTENVRVKRHVIVRTPDVPNVIGIDPGGVCGVASYNVRGFESFQAPGADALALIERLVERSVTLSCVIIGCQRYVMTGRPKSQQSQALRTVGALQELERTRTDVRLELQNSADAAKSGSPAVLKRLGWWKPGHVHANDAAAHVALTLLRHFPTMWAELLGV